MRYTEVLFTFQGEEWQRDLLISELADIGFDTFEHTDHGFKGYIASAKVDIIALEQLLFGQWDEVAIHYELREIEPRNWNEAWESNFQPIDVGGICRVRATFHPASDGYDYEIVIDPKMAFGTGHHQTTTMMMEYILEEDMEGKTVLDMGCGTGILAILAVKKGADRVVAIDYDPVCYESTQENALLNKVEKKVAALCGSVEAIPAQEQFDVILANINRNILMEQLPDYAAVLKPGGIVLISGFYRGADAGMLQEKASENNLIYVSQRELDQWVAVRLTKSK
jgi:ribosomal protein L11 methyltransferase